MCQQSNFSGILAFGRDSAVHKMLRVAFTITLWAAVSCAEFVNQPTSVVYKQGVDSTGYVACKISPPNLNVIWNIQLLNVPHPQVIYSSPSFFNDQLETKYSINTDASSTGNYSLIIHNLERGDSGRYTCQVSSLGTQAANVTVAGKLFGCILDSRICSVNILNSVSLIQHSIW